MKYLKIPRLIRLNLIISSFVFLTMFSFTLSAQIENGDLDQVNKLNAKLTELFRLRKFEEAKPFAQNIIELREKELGAEHVEVAKALQNLGLIHYVLSEFSFAESQFERAIRIFEEQKNLDDESNLLLAQVLENLALVKFGNRKDDEAELLLLKSITLYKNDEAKYSSKVAEIYMSLGNLKYRSKKHKESAKFFEEAFARLYKNLGTKEFATLDAFDRCLCSLKKASKEKEINLLMRKFYPAGELLKNGVLVLDKIKAEKIGNNQGRVIVPDGKGYDKGKAISLPKPMFPLEQRGKLYASLVNVNVKIDQIGNVFFACGAYNKVPESLVESSESAAYRAKFTPTLLNGKPVKATAVIVYKFL